MKKTCFKYILCGLMLAALTGCGAAGADQTGGADAASAKNLRQAGLGAMTLLYDDTVWTYDEEKGSDSSLAFTAADDSLLGFSCSRESFYQHPLDMIAITGQICSTYPGFEEVEAPTAVQVQGDEWYEWTYRYEENGVMTVALQRFYGKNYYAYTMSYIAQEESYEANKSEALKVMNSAVMSVPDNEEGEKKAKEFLAGEWDLGGSGYLVLDADGTYTWYMDAGKDEKNMHKGTYGGDIANESLGFAEGEGIYFVLFPEVLYTDGEAGRTANAKYDYAVSLEQQNDGSYQMVNAATFSIYSMMKQK